jgi:peptidyl-tRNA hydrolase
VLGVDSQQDMLLQQAAARALLIPTHTFAGADRVNKQRTVMAVGPAPAESLDHITGHLRDLAG